MEYLSITKKYNLVCQGFYYVSGAPDQTPFTSSAIVNSVFQIKYLIEVKRKLLYSNETSNGTCLCGIEFVGIDLGINLIRTMGEGRHGRKMGEATCLCRDLPAMQQTSGQ